MRLRHFLIASLLVHALLVGLLVLPRPPEPGPRALLVARLLSPLSTPGKPWVAPPPKKAPGPPPPQPQERAPEEPPSLQETPPAPPARRTPPEGTEKAPVEAPEQTPAAPGAPSLLQALRQEARALVDSRMKAQGMSNAITLGTQGLRYEGYLQRLKERIESVWVYPPRAAEQGLYGEMVALFTILKDGSLGEVRLLRTSGHPLLDEAALKALRDAQPFWPLPEGWGREAITIEGHFIYTLYGLYLR